MPAGGVWPFLAPLGQPRCVCGNCDWGPFRPSLALAAGFAAALMIARHGLPGGLWTGVVGGVLTPVFVVVALRKHHAP